VLDLDQLLRFAVEHGASDVHLKVGSRPRLRVDGSLREAPFDTVEPADTDRLAAGIMPAARAAAFRATNEADFTYGIAGLGRFRVNAFRQRGFVGLVLRRVLPGIPGFEALSLPPSVSALVDRSQGLVLVTGLAGSGKTSTLAAMIDRVNAARACHIVTVEDPVEVLHPDKLAIVDQREVGTDTESLHAGLVHALRQDPDVVMVGELDDATTAWAALQAAEAGVLVLSTLPTADAIESIDRLIEMFPPHQQRQVRATLARVLRGIVSQRLLPRAGGRGRVPAVEVLVVNSRVAERILDPLRLVELEKEMAEGDLYGMQTFDQSIEGLYRSGLIGRDEAIARAQRAADLRITLDRLDFERGAPASAARPPAPRPRRTEGAPAGSPPPAAPAQPPTPPAPQVPTPETPAAGS
jgi:twitching motility protein PilT